MKVKLAKSWDNCASSTAMTAYNLGMLRVAAETESVMYILAKINEIYAEAKKDNKTGGVYAIQLKLLIDDVVYKLLRLGVCKSDFKGWPTIHGPRADRYIPDIRTIKIERVHLIKALTPTRYLH
jgi:hypothetical protein